MIALIPGWILLCALAAISIFLSDLVVIAGKHPLEASAVAIVLGILINSYRKLPPRFHLGVKSSEQILIWGIVLLGTGLDFHLLLDQGFNIMLIVLCTMLLGFLSIVALGKILRLSPALTMLLASGTTICGTSAIAITAPLIKAREEETSYAITTIALLGLIATLLYPLIAKLVGTSDIAFGIFAGTAIHSTPQVVGAGFIFSDLAGRTATAVKLLRNCFMAPVAMIIALLYREPGNQSKLSRAEIMRAFPWFLFWYFIMAALASIGFFGPTLLEFLNKLGKFMILIGMVGIGLNTDLSSIRALGFKPLQAGALASIIVAIISIVMIGALL